jgi:heterodisulfide reductase subunit B
MSLALPAQVLAQAEKQNFDELLIPCAACYNRLASTKYELAKCESMRSKVVKMIEKNYTGNITLKNMLEILEMTFTPAIQKELPYQFPYKVACYYGCLLVRPQKELDSERIEDPQQMDKIMKQIGATPLNWGMKTECCGASFSITRTDIVGKLCGNIIEDAVSRGAEAIIVACPMCHSNLDMRRKEIEKIAGKRFNLPVLYITQALGIAMGLDSKSLGLHRHFVPVTLQGKSKVQPDKLEQNKK